MFYARCGRAISVVLNESFLSRRLPVRMSALERVMSSNTAAEELLESLKQEFNALKNEKASRLVEKLKVENDVLRQQVEAALQKLIELETQNGKKQIPMPGDKAQKEKPAGEGKGVAPAAVQEQGEAALQKPNELEMQNGKKQIQMPGDKPQKEKKPKKEKPAGEGKGVAPAAVQEAPIDVGRLDMRVGKIVEVSRHPDADALYLEKIDVGEANPRTIISGLVKFVPIEEMQNRMVVVLCNLKPAKMRGILSEGMVMCASTPDKVEVLAPPIGSVPGDLVHVEGYPREADALMNPKKKIFETVAPDLHTNEQLIACYKEGEFFVPGKGRVLSQTLKNVQVK
ncbi:aminoacyl tRNA synthase complex-interacting multifunctional protein 1 [Ochlerotatus camptorhynchus]|uniref:aminoacyl tRNA synthase complex-interacting multifunctional protein 1 n=1 Tax=Ochlerotatus camptorhynchus TaxID=644619 RepID=UPI0031D60581